MMSMLRGRKTYIVAAGIMAGIFFNTWTGHDFNLGATLAALDWKGIGEAVAMMCLRAGVAKAGG